MDTPFKIRSFKITTPLGGTYPFREYTEASHEQAKYLYIGTLYSQVTDVTKASNLAQSFLSTCQLILEGVPVTNGPNYRKKGVNFHL